MIALLLLIFVVSGCSAAPTMEYWPTQEWQTQSLEEQGLSPALIELMEYDAEAYRISNIMIIRNGYRVYNRFIHEGYMRGAEEDLVPIYSCTKSITSALIGIALGQGHIESIEQKVSDFFPEWQALEPNLSRDSMTLEHLLNMTSGWSWGENRMWSSLEPFTSSEDWVQFVLGQRMLYAPGTTFFYNTGGSHLLSVVIERSTGMDTLSYARTYLFDPIGVGEVEWQRDPQGYYTGGHDLWMRAEDMARFGLLYLNQGKWDGNQIIPAEWVEISTAHQSTERGISGLYGYHWWVTPLVVRDKPVETYFALGFAGQYIYVVPEFDLVVVATSQNVENPTVIKTFMENYILPPLVIE